MLNFLKIATSLTAHRKNGKVGLHSPHVTAMHEIYREEAVGLKIPIILKKL